MSDQLPEWQQDNLAALLDALDGVPVTDAERATLEWLAGRGIDTVANMVALFIKARKRV
jgi:hypothetical protein